MMLLFKKHPAGLDIPQVLELNQLIFGTLCKHKWLVFDPFKERFTLSRLGYEVLEYISGWKIYRKTNNNRLSGYASQGMPLKIISFKSIKKRA
jgi:hypothetical protein